MLSKDLILETAIDRSCQHGCKGAGTSKGQIQAGQRATALGIRPGTAADRPVNLLTIYTVKLIQTSKIFVSNQEGAAS